MNLNKLNIYQTDVIKSIAYGIANLTNLASLNLGLQGNIMQIDDAKAIAQGISKLTK